MFFYLHFSVSLNYLFIHIYSLIRSFVRSFIHLSAQIFIMHFKNLKQIFYLSLTFILSALSILLLSHRGIACFENIGVLQDYASYSYCCCCCCFCFGYLKPKILHHLVVHSLRLLARLYFHSQAHSHSFSHSFIQSVIMNS